VRYLIISDIHANLQALDAVLADAAALGYDASVCLGDLVGYGADPAGAIARVQALAPVATRSAPASNPRPCSTTRLGARPSGRLKP
jgi:Icc-related predicted phosphoesterase